jgi:hypothetical protein
MNEQYLSSDFRPLTLDELAALPDVSSSAEMPQDIAEEFAQERVYISGVQEELISAGRLRRLEDGADEWELRLPAGAVVGRPGRDIVELESSELDQKDQPSPDAFRPEWIPQSYQPRLVNEYPFYPPLRRADGTPVQPLFLFPPENRTAYRPDTYPNNCTGRLFVWNNFTSANMNMPDSSGSGTLVGPRHVLTAKHVLPTTTTPNWKILFIAAYYQGQSVYGPNAQSFVSNIVSLSGNGAAHDVAVLRLNDPLGSSVGWLATQAYQPQWNGGAYWTKTGYPYDVAGSLKPSAESGITVVNAVPDGTSLELDHRADVAAGSSGGPLFGFFDAHLFPGATTDPSIPLVVGVTSGGSQSTTTGVPINTDAGGWPLDSIVAFARNYWP